MSDIRGRLVYIVTYPYLPPMGARQGGLERGGVEQCPTFHSVASEVVLGRLMSIGYGHGSDRLVFLGPIPLTCA